MKIELIDVRKYTNIEHFQLQVSGTSCRNYEKLVDKVNAEIVKQLELDPRAKDIELKKYENDSFNSVEFNDCSLTVSYVDTDGTLEYDLYATATSTDKDLVDSILMKTLKAISE